MLVRRTSCGLGTSRVDSLSSVVRGKALIRYLPRVCYIPRVVDDTEVSRISWVRRITSEKCRTIRIAVSTVKDSWVVLLKLRPTFSLKPSVCVCVVLKRCRYNHDNHNNMIKFGDLTYRVNPDGLALINT